MARPSRENPEVRAFILTHIATHPDRIGPMTVEKFGLSRTAVSGYLRRLVAEGVLTAAGATRARIYARKPLARVSLDLQLSPATAEDMIWRFRLLPAMGDLPRNIIDICQYGFTEILNNAVDHSTSETATIGLIRYHDSTDIVVIDNGIGIFEKIRRDFGLEDPRHALLELAKGKLTSDPKRHAGEGIFFTSRMFSEFHLRSHDLFYSRTMTSDHEWLVETERMVKPISGTGVQMIISHHADWTTREVFDRYQEPGHISFRKTHVPVALGRYPGEQLVSRSQAKRILARFDRFTEVLLDFAGVDDIGQAFADEIFRVFAQEHPHIPLHFINATAAIRAMIAHVGGAPPDAPRLPGL